MLPNVIKAWKASLLGLLMITIPAYFVQTGKITGTEYIGFLSAGSWLLGNDPFNEVTPDQNDAPDA